MQDKAHMRERYRRERREAFVPAVYSNILATPEVMQATIIASYVSYGSEPSTVELNRALIKSGITLLLPRVNKDQIDWIYWDGDENKLVENKKILEPVGEVVSNLPAIDVVIVPALRIDRDGYRLGQGGGYYDRTLPLMSGWKIALVHSGEVTSEILPRESHDIAVDAAATPDLIVRFNKING
jgi:5-formyltetrahydrofolate cyclo-ligase